MENNKYRNTNDIDDAEYRRMRKSEDSSYEYHGADDEEIDEANADDGYEIGRTRRNVKGIISGRLFLRK